MPKINAREQTRNKAQAKKRERNRELRNSLATPTGRRGEEDQGQAGRR